jgi:phosphoribosylamine--glycine ligase
LDAQNLAIPETDHAEIVRYATRQKIGLVVIGPEAPLAAGLSDALRAADVAVFGPSKDAAMLEGSKVFCKEILLDAKAPTAAARVFVNMDDVDGHLAAHKGPCVVKADGLAAGKGVVVCDDADQARRAAERMLVDGEFGDAGRRILVEERLVGQEVSVLAISDGKTLVTLPPCQDHKAAWDGDRGPNTGGMGAYCPASVLDDASMRIVEREILVPVLHAMRRAKRRFQGVLYAGLMLTPAGPKVLEFNVRFGDPECQPLLMRLQSDLLEVLLASATGRLDEVELSWDPRPSVCVVAASGGYPGRYKVGFPIRGLAEADSIPDVKVFHAGTQRDGDRIVTSGGRVLGVTALGADLRDAQRRCYDAVRAIDFDGMTYRRDIADKGLADAV